MNRKFRIYIVHMIAQSETMCAVELQGETNMFEFRRVRDSINAFFACAIAAGMNVTSADVLSVTRQMRNQHARITWEPGRSGMSITLQRVELP